jgi:hypothetical protein
VEIGVKNMIALTGKSKTCVNMQELDGASLGTIIEERDPYVSLIHGPSNVGCLFQLSWRIAGIGFKAYLPGRAPELRGFESRRVFDDAGGLQTLL